MLNFTKKILRAILLTTVLAGTTQAATTKIATINITAQAISIEGNQGFSHVTFRISGPDGFYVKNYLGDGKVSLIVDDFSSLKDGYYQYELSAATAEKNILIRQGQNNTGRGDNQGQAFIPAHQSGGFMIQGGYVITSDKRINNKRMLEEGGDQDEI